MSKNKFAAQQKQLVKLFRLNGADASMNALLKHGH
jgi:hypothetical protein